MKKQWKFVNKAFQKCKRMYIAGDDDQAIYEWSGADVQYFLNLKGDKQILNKSWRLPSNIHNYSEKITDLISKRVTKEFKSKKEGGKVQTLNSFKEITIDNESTWLFLARNNWHLKQIEEWLKSKGLVYERKDKLSVNYKLIEAINAYTNKSQGKEITNSQKLLCDFYMKKSNNFDTTWFKAFTKLNQDTITYYRDLISNKTNLKKCNIKVSTIHGIKGGEADNVILLLDYTKTIHNNYISNQDSELRCYYVAVTRTKNNLYLVRPEKQYGYPLIKEAINE